MPRSSTIFRQPSSDWLSPHWLRSRPKWSDDCRNTHLDRELMTARARRRPDRLHANMLSFGGNALPHRMPHRRAAASQRGEQPSPHAGPIIETAIPTRLDALPFGRFHILVIAALGITWILDGLEVTLAGSLSGELKKQLRFGPQQQRSRPRRKLLSGRRGLWSVLVRLADGSPRPEEAVHYHPRRLSVGDGRDGAVMELLEFRVVPFGYGRRHRR